MSNPNHDPKTGEFSSGHNADSERGRGIREHVARQHALASSRVAIARRDLELHLREILRTHYKQV